MEEILRKAVQDALANVGVSEASFVIEWPADMAHGDYATNAALAAAKPLGKNPRELAEELAGTLRQSLSDSVSSIAVAGPGFINFTLARPVITGMVKEAVELGGEWGKGGALESKRVMFEYTDPNPFKEMHIGHLMSNVIGEAIARITENAGASIVRANYEGDVGPHVAKALWGLRQKGITDPATAKEIGDAYAHGSRAYEESENAKADIDALNVAIYEGKDEELMELWRKGRDVSLAAFETVYAALGTKFDYYFFESETVGLGMELVRDALARGIFRESEGAVIYPGEEHGLHTLVFITSQGTPTYEAKELGLAFLKEERWPSDRSYILTAAEQIGHFKVALAAMSEVAPHLAAKTRHIPHGFLRLTSGKMSSREGNVITAAGLIEEMTRRAGQKNEDPLIAEAVAVAAIKYMILRASPGGDIVFDEERSLSLEGDSGPYLQYALVRARSILREAAGKSGEGEAPDEASALERLLVRFPEVCAQAANEEAPQKLTQYLTQLAGAWNSFYAAERIIGSEHEGYKLALAKAFATTMENGLSILSIPTPERM